MAEKLPFTFTPNIIRYLKEVIEMYEMHVQGVPRDVPFVPFSKIIYAYYPDETFYSFSEPNRLAFAEYVGRNDAVVITDNDEGENFFFEDKQEFWPTEEDDDGRDNPTILKGMGTHPWEIQFDINDMRPLLKVWQMNLMQKGTPTLLKDIEIENLSYKNGRLVYFDKIHTFHKGKDSKASLLKLFEKLWEERQHSVNGTMTKTGTPLTLDALKNRIGTEPLRMELFNLESRLRGKGMPIQIEKDGDSVLLVVNEVF